MSAMRNEETIYDMEQKLESQIEESICNSIKFIISGPSTQK